jgi:hypothetical protein
MARKVRKDKTGLYVKFNDRIFRPTLPTKTAIQMGSVGISTANQPNAIYVVQYGTAANWSPAQPRVGEVWSTTDPAKVPKPDPNQTLVKVRAGGVDINVLVSSKGALRLTNGSTVMTNSKRSADIAMSMNGTAVMSFQEFQDLVDQVNTAISELKVRGIVSSLAAEVAAEDQLQEYLAEKGLT